MEKIEKLNKLISYYNLDGYIVPKNDEFFNEYIPQFNDRLKFISSFSGSYGIALIMKKKRYLFVDGRYKLQAKIESGKLFNIALISEKFPTYLANQNNLKIGFDPKLHTNKSLKFFSNKKNFNLIPIKQNLIEKIWVRKNLVKVKKFYYLPKRAYRENYKIKIKKLIKVLKKKKIDLQFISSGENIAWLLNIRGRDTNYTPIPNAYLILNKKKQMHFFCDPKKVDKLFKNKYKNIKFIDIKFFDLYLSKIKNKNVLIDSSTCSIHYENILKRNNKILNFLDPISIFKCVKSNIEIKNIIQCHIYDGAALTKFLFWIKNNFKKKKIYEISAQEKLLKFRKKNKHFKFLSFPTISSSGPNGAIIHYKASKKSNRLLKNKDIYLVDSGGQYNFGTTDVTRTISLGNQNKRIKNIFTRVLKGHIAVASFNLKLKSNGSQIDIEARKPLKKINLNYAHGTGHGVGYFLNVHEGPHAISKNNKVVFKEGMIVSNEPGYYEDGKFGIRIENLIRVKKNLKGLSFDNLTMVPIDKTLINKKLLTVNEVKWLNNYHSTVFRNLKSFMNKKELINLKFACSQI